MAQLGRVFHGRGPAIPLQLGREVVGFPLAQRLAEIARELSLDVAQRLDCNLDSRALTR